MKIRLTRSKVADIRMLGTNGGLVNKTILPVRVGDGGLVTCEDYSFFATKPATIATMDCVLTLPKGLITGGLFEVKWTKKITKRRVGKGDHVTVTWSPDGLVKLEGD